MAGMGSSSSLPSPAATGRPRSPAAPLPLPQLQASRPLKPPYSVESIFRTFAIRRAALIRALTTDVEAFFQKCEPAGMQLLYLCGNTDGSWEVKRPELCVPPSQPPPPLGINISRDYTKKRHEWLQGVAVHCDAWLINISFFFGLHLTAKERDRLFTMISSLQTVQEALLASKTYRRICHLEGKRSRGPVEENEEEEEEATSEYKNFCASCGDRYRSNAFWIRCNVCDRGYHGRCVKMTASKAEHIEHYECPECCSEKVGHDYDVDPMLSDLFKRY
ncbi:hypothetical protein PAHAL_3G308100 [Panicum hallii]|uniref:PHD finger protein ALFIN-LIKE n=2 Tax=Panicum hallii TaxID=206008 RepID=A0A2S3HCQ9_9POAL|nr:hypothetical protein PAHAL_3G308100 [Panicum hallii]